MVVDTTSQTTILALTCHTCAGPLRFSCAVTAKEHVAEASTDLPLRIFHLGDHSWDIPFPHQAATSDQPRTPPRGEGHLPDPASLMHLPLPCRKLRHDPAAHVGSQKQLRAERARIDYREKTMSAELGVCEVYGRASPSAAHDCWRYVRLGWHRHRISLHRAAYGHGTAPKTVPDRG